MKSYFALRIASENSALNTLVGYFFERNVELYVM